MRKTSLVVGIVCSIMPLVPCCSSRQARQHAAWEATGQGTTLQEECEARLSILHDKIEEASFVSLPDAAFEELKEIFFSAQELYLKGCYQEALRLIEEAMSLMEEMQD